MQAEAWSSANRQSTPYVLHEKHHCVSHALQMVLVFFCLFHWPKFVGNGANARKRSGLVSKRYYARRSDVCFFGVFAPTVMISLSFSSPF